MIRTVLLLAASLAFIASAQTADTPQEAPVALERKLHGAWKGGPCGGEWTFAADGAYEVQHYSPGNDKLTVAWELRWIALPPTLVLTCKTSDAPERIKVGEVWEVKLIQLDDEALAYEWPQDPGHPVRWTRAKK